MVTYELKKDAKLTDSEREALKKAKSMPVIYDDDSPEMSPVSFLWRYLIHSNRFFQSLSPFYSKGLFAFRLYFLIHPQSCCQQSLYNQAALHPLFRQ